MSWQAWKPSSNLHVSCAWNHQPSLHHIKLQLSRCYKSLNFCFSTVVCLLKETKNIKSLQKGNGSLKYALRLVRVTRFKTICWLSLCSLLCSSVLERDATHDCVSFSSYWYDRVKVPKLYNFSFHKMEEERHERQRVTLPFGITMVKLMVLEWSRPCLLSLAKENRKELTLFSYLQFNTLFEPISLCKTLSPKCLRSAS